MRPGLPATGILAAVALLVLSIASYVSISAAFLSGAGGFQRLPKSSGCSSHPRTLTPTRASSRPSPCFFMLNSGDENLELGVARTLATLLAGVTVVLSSGGAVLADGSTQKFSLPPISTSKDRCVFKSSAMGQANAARDKLYDLRQCDLSGKSASGFDLSGVIASEADFSQGDFKEVVMSKAYARNSNWENADFTNAIVDRVSFDGSSMKGAVFQNAVLTSTSFSGANVEDADFTEAYMGEFDQRNLCKNPTLKGTNPVTKVDTRQSVGCP